MNAGLRDQPEDCVATKGEVGSTGYEKRRQEPARQLALEPFCDHLRESAVSRGHQRPRKGNPLGLIAVYKQRIGAALQYVCELPAQIYGIADAGIHALPASGAVNMSGVPQKKGAAGLESVRDTVVHAVGRKPIHLRHFYVQQILNLAPDVLKSQLGVFRQLRRHKADQPLHAARANGKHQREDMRAEIDVEIALEAAVYLHVGDEKSWSYVPPGNPTPSVSRTALRAPSQPHI